jgi:hypothetical protein
MIVGESRVQIERKKFVRTESNVCSLARSMYSYTVVQEYDTLYCTYTVVLLYVYGLGDARL